MIHSLRFFGRSGLTTRTTLSFIILLVLVSYNPTPRCTRSGYLEIKTRLITRAAETDILIQRTFHEDNMLYSR